jgi:hypothetical protein
MGAGTIILGALLLLLGIGLTVTLIGAVVGIPVIILALIVLVIGLRERPRVYVRPQPMAPFPLPPPSTANGPQTVVIHNYAPSGSKVLLRCRYCNSVYAEEEAKCPHCGATF